MILFNSGFAGAIVAGLSAAMLWPATSVAHTAGSTEQFGFSGFDVGRAIGVDDTGVYLMGAVSGTLPGQTYGGGPDDAFLRRYEFDGTEVWTRQFGTTGDDFPMSGEVGLDDSGVYVGGITSDAFAGDENLGPYDMFLRRYDRDGSLIWARQFGTAGDDFFDAVAVKRGGVFVSGYTGGELGGQPNGGDLDAFIRRYDYEGNVVWTRQFGGAGSEDFQGLFVDRSGVYAVGFVTTEPGFAGDTDALVAKYDLDGNLVWVRQFGTDGVDALESVVVAAGGVYIAGMTEGTLPGQVSAGGEDIVVGKYDLDGDEVWTRQFGTAGNDGASFRDLAADGRSVYITGNVAGALPGQSRLGSRDAFVRRYSFDGTEVMTLQFGTVGDDRGIAIADDDHGNLYIAGRTSGAFPGYTYAGGTDSFITRIGFSEN